MLVSGDAMLFTVLPELRSRSPRPSESRNAGTSLIVITAFKRVITNVAFLPAVRRNFAQIAVLTAPVSVASGRKSHRYGTACMNIHEYQAKALLRSYGAPVSDGRVGAEGRRGQDRGGRARRPALGGQGADPRRRPRQGQVQGTRGRRKGRRPPRAVGRGGRRRWPSRCWAAPWSPTRPAPPASRSTASTSRTAPTSRASSTSRC